MQKSIAIVAGGTAGHVFPAQAVAEILSTKNKVVFFTDDRGIKYLDKNQQSVKLWIKNLSRNPFKKMRSLFFLGISTLKVLYILKKERVKIAIGFGGLTSFPVLYAAKMLKIPIILHEQNAALGKANKFFHKYAKFLATSFENTIGIDSKYKVIYIGNPLRKEVLEVKRRRTRITKEIYITILGGSQGATIFDSTVAAAISSLPSDLQKNIRIFQQVREENIDSVKSIYESSNIRSYELESFFSDALQLIADSDLVITRGGASALFEIEQLKVPAIIIPMRAAADDHQFHNAEQFALRNKAKILLEKDFSVELLRVLLEELFVNNEIENIQNNKKISSENNAAQKFAIQINQVIIDMRL